MTQPPTYAQLRIQIQLDFDTSRQGFVALRLDPTHPFAASLAARPVPLFVSIETIDQVTAQLSLYHPHVIHEICEAVQKYYKLGLVTKSLGHSEDYSAENPLGTYYVFMRYDRGLTHNDLVRLIGPQNLAALPVGPVSPSVRNYIAEREEIQRQNDRARAIAEAREDELAERRRRGNQSASPRNTTGTSTRASPVPGDRRGAFTDTHIQGSGVRPFYQRPHFTPSYGPPSFGPRPAYTPTYIEPGPMHGPTTAPGSNQETPGQGTRGGYGLTTSPVGPHFFPGGRGGYDPVGRGGIGHGYQGYPGYEQAIQSGAQGGTQTGLPGGETGGYATIQTGIQPGAWAGPVGRGNAGHAYQGHPGYQGPTGRAVQAGAQNMPTGQGTVGLGYSWYTVGSAQVGAQAGVAPIPGQPAGQETATVTTQGASQHDSETTVRTEFHGRSGQSGSARGSGRGRGRRQGRE